MKMVALQFIFVALLFSSNAHALETNRFFPQAVTENLAYLGSHLDALIGDRQTDGTLLTSSCQKEQQKIARWLEEYANESYFSKNTTDGKSKKIIHFLHDLEKKNDACFTIAAKTYIVGSVFLISPSHHRFNPKAWTKYHMKEEQPGYSLTLLGASVANRVTPKGNPFLQILTDSKRKQLGDAWLDFNADHSAYKVSAGYDCASKSIYLTPYLSPFDLAATFIHEMDHLFKDRLIDDSIFKYFFDGNLKTYLLMDEASSIALSAYFQKSMQAENIPVVKTNWLDVALDAYHPSYYQKKLLKPAYVIDSDLSLFNREDGPINQIWKLLVDSGIKYPELMPSASYFLSQTFFKKQDELITAPFRFGPPFPINADKQVKSIYDIVHQVYFPGETLTDAQIESLKPENQLIHFAVLANWIQENELKLDLDLTKLLKELETIFAKLDSADQSPACTLYTDAVQNHTIGSYVGARLSDSKGMRPGETGVKAGETGVKPGETGVKPGETGVKPGEAGVKPGETGVKPCLDIDHLL